MIAEPGAGSRQVAGAQDGEIGEGGAGLPGVIGIIAEQGGDMSGDGFGAERADGNGEVKGWVWSLDAETQVPAQAGIEAAVIGEEVRRQMDFPMGQFRLERADPFGDAGFSAVDFLTFADQADDDAPIVAAIHDGKQERWLGLIETGLATLFAHEIGGLFAIPGSLGFVEDHDMF